MDKFTRKVKLGGMKRLVTLYIPTSGKDRIPEGSRSIRLHEGYKNITDKVGSVFDLIKSNSMRDYTKYSDEYFKDHPDWVYYGIENG